MTRSKADYDWVELALGNIRDHVRDGHWFEAFNACLFLQTEILIRWRDKRGGLSARRAPRRAPS